MSPDEVSALRERLGVTQEELARLVGVSSMTVSRWERGVAKPSRLADQQLAKLARKKGRTTD